MFLLREVRTAKGMSMKELGNIFGLAESTISLYETEKRQPDFSTLIKFAEYFDVSVDYLLGRNIDNKRRKDMLYSKTPNFDKQYSESKDLQRDYNHALRDSFENFKSFICSSFNLPSEELQVVLQRHPKSPSSICGSSDTFLSADALEVAEAYARLETPEAKNGVRRYLNLPELPAEGNVSENPGA